MKSQFIYDEHGRQIGLNWDALRPKSTPESRAPALPLPPLPARAPRVLAPGNRVGENLRKRGGDRHVPERIFDYQEIADLWSAGKTNKEIVALVGCGQSTILSALKAIQPEGYDGKSGPRRAEKCKRDHDLSVHGKEQPRGGRMCMECKRERERVAWKRKQEEAKA